MSFTRRRPTGLTILPPSPTTNTTSSDRSQPPPQLQPLQTQLLSPTSASPHPLSPRGSPLPPSPAISHHSYSTFSGVPAIPVAGGAGRRGSVGTARSDVSSAAGSASTSGVGSRDKDRDRDRGPVPPVKVDKRLPGLPGSPGAGAQGQPQRKGTGTGGGQVDAGAGKGGWAGAYDNRLVSSTLSHLPPLPPLSPTPTGSSNPSASTHSQAQSAIQQRLKPHPHPGLLHSQRSSIFTHASSSITGQKQGPANLPHPLPLPVPLRNHSTSTSFAPSHPNLSTTGLVVLPDGTALSTSPEASTHPTDGRSVVETMVHSSASSPWSVLTVHVLPLFAGGALKTPVEDLNQLCNSHIIATSQRVPPSRILAVLSSDLRDFIASGMLTLKAKFETLEEAKVVLRAAEVWSFFWAQVLPYLEGVFLPFTQIKDRPSSTTSSPISVRHLLLSGFLLHILLPLLPRLIPIIALADQSPTSTRGTANRNPVSPISTSPRPGSSPTPLPTPSLPDLQRLLQTSLVLSTQARYSTFFPSRDIEENNRRDEETRQNVDALGKAVRWRIGVIQRNAEIRTGDSLAGAPNGNHDLDMVQDGTPSAPKRHSLHRGPSLSQSGKYRRRGWRASAHMSQVYGEAPTALGLPHGTSGAGTATRQNSDFGVGGPWGAGRYGAEGEEDDDEDDSTTPGQSFAYGYHQNQNQASTRHPPERQSCTQSSVAGDSNGTLTGSGIANSSASSAYTATPTGTARYNDIDIIPYRGQAYGNGQGLNRNVNSSNNNNNNDYNHKTPQAAGLSTGIAGPIDRRANVKRQESEMSMSSVSGDSEVTPVAGAGWRR